jgi:hypothetical protein
VVSVSQIQMRIFDNSYKIETVHRGQYTQLIFLYFFCVCCALCTVYFPFLIELLIIVALHVCIDTADDIEDHTDYDDETRTRDEEVDLSRTRE